MNEMPKLTLDEMRAAAEKLVQAGGEVREKLRELTLRALTQGALAEDEIRAALSAIAEGVGQGAGQRAEAVKSALGDALQGMDDALSHAAEAMQLAIHEVASDVKQFREQDLQQGLNDLKGLEAMFLDVVGRVADGAGGLVKQEMNAVAEHGRRVGTDTGGRVKALAEDLRRRIRIAAHGVADAGKDAAKDVAARIATKASQKLGDVAARIGEKAEQLKPGK